MIQKKQEPLVSIIVNCFNGERFLRQALDSILSQTYQNWEVIFWDNQSTDKSAEIYKSYNEERFKYFYAPKHTLVAEARNLAIDKSTGVEAICAKHAANPLSIDGIKTPPDTILPLPTIEAVLIAVSYALAICDAVSAPKL